MEPATNDDTNVFLFVPNVIGYARILLAILSCIFMPTNMPRAALCYMVSGLLDAFDGYAARLLNQSSRFGAMLDQLTDRCATLALLMMLGHFYPKYIFFFQMSAVIDIASHWLHLHSHDLTGSQSHKDVSRTTNPVLRLYYTSRPFLFFMCAGNELFYCLLYVCYFNHGPKIPVISVGMFQALAALCFPIAVLKSIISLVHLVQASQAVVEVDVQQRRRLQEAKTQ